MTFWKAVVLLLIFMTAGCWGFTPRDDRLDPARGQSRAALSKWAAADLPAVRTAEIMKEKAPVPFARFAQCQYAFALDRDDSTGLPTALPGCEEKIFQCLEAAAREGAHVVVLPELALAFPQGSRSRVTDKICAIAERSGMIVIAGSFYDEGRFSRLAVISGEGVVTGFKLRPSRYEASPRSGLGMTPGESLLVLHTPYGRLAVVTCVDLISDAVQYMLRSLATRGEIDAIVNINYNPAAWEFLVEANSLARRHPVFVSITNVAGDPSKMGACFSGGVPRDNGYCFGNSALFGGVRTRSEDCPNCFKAIEDFVGDQFKTSPGGPRSIPYDVMLANIPVFEEAMLLYDLNLRMKQEPLATNAPDQGYPTVRSLRKIPLR